MDKNTTITTIDLIRHGEPVGGKKFRGSTDDPLSELGWQQMTAAVASTTEWERESYPVRIFQWYLTSVARQFILVFSKCIPA